MRVLHCIYDDPSNPWVGGGGSHRVFELYRRLTDRVDATVLTGNFPGAGDESRDGVAYERLGLAAPYALSRLSFGAQASRRLRTDHYDAAVFDFSGYTPIALPRRRPTGIVVHMLHGPDAPERWGRPLGAGVAALERWMLRRSRRVCVTSEWLRGRLEPVVAPGTRVDLVRSGVDDAFFGVRREERDYLLFYGRFDVFQKGLDVLVDAFARLRRDRPSLMLHLVGRGKDAQPLRALLRQAGVADAAEVVERPTRERVLREMAGALALLHPSRFEGLPMVPAEAMAAGVPVIATSVGAVDEVVAPPGGGTLIPVGDVEALVRATERLLADPEQRGRTSRSARRSAERFRWEAVVGQHHAFLDGIARGP